MRVTIVSRIFTPEPAAAAFALHAIAERLRERGVDVTVLTTRAPAGAVVDDPSGVRVRRAPVLRDKNGYVRGYLQYLSYDVPLFFRILGAGRPDVLFVEPPPSTGAIVRVAAKLLRVPYVYDAADIWSDAVRHSGSPRPVARVLLAIERFAVRGAAGLVTISRGVEARLRELGVTRPVSVTGFGADTRSFAFVPADGATTRSSFVYPGSYSSWHGADVLVEGFARFAAAHPTYRLLFVGNGTERDVLQSLAVRLGVGDRVEFRPAVEPHELTRILANATAALASLRPDAGYDYAFTTKVYSALAAGCPVLFSGPGPTAAFIEDAARTLPVGFAVTADAEGVADALSRLADSPPTADERRAIAEWTASEHSLAAVADRVCDAIENVVEATT